MLRSEHDFATTADALAGGDQTLVNEGTGTQVVDDRVEEGKTYFYTVFAQDELGAWELQVKTRLANRDRLGWLHPDYADDDSSANDLAERMRSLHSLEGTQYANDEYMRCLMLTDEAANRGLE